MSTSGTNKAAPVAIGIDLGTSKCCVGVVRNGKVEILENERGNKTTPSYVAFTDTERLIGEEAKEQAALNPTNTVYAIKRIIGRKYYDSDLIKYMQHLPFGIGNNRGKPVVKVKHENESKSLHPEQITAMLLTKMKEIAESHLKCSVESAVISVPAYFNNAQRQATKDAADIAGLKVLALINEPTAAAIAYLDNKKSVNEDLLVIDFGGGKLDVAVMNVQDGLVEVQSVSGHTCFGGADIDIMLLNLVYSPEKLHDGKIYRRIINACEKMKMSNSSLGKGYADLTYVADDLKLSIKRTEFVKKCRDLVTSFIHPILKMIPSDKVNKILLTGGSCRLSFIEELLSDSISAQCDKTMLDDGTVACGAAIRAAILQGGYSGREIKDVCPHSVFTVNGRKINTVIEFNTAIPVSGKLPCLEYKSLKGIEFRELYSPLGDRKTAQIIGNLKPSKLNNNISNEFIITYLINSDGIFDAQLYVKKIIYDSSLESEHNLDKYTIHDLANDHQIFVSETKAEGKRQIAVLSLESFCLKHKRLSEEHLGSKSAVLYQSVYDECCTTTEWLDRTPSPSLSNCKEKIDYISALFNDAESHRINDAASDNPCNNQRKKVV